MRLSSLLPCSCARIRVASLLELAAHFPAGRSFRNVIIYASPAEGDNRLIHTASSVLNECEHGDGHGASGDNGSFAVVRFTRKIIECENFAEQPLKVRYRLLVQGGCGVSSGSRCCL